eukprot:COSAG05_NODE_3188_length_2256_cov_1.159870_1_plen_61_part_10
MGLLFFTLLSTHSVAVATVSHCYMRLINYYNSAVLTERQTGGGGGQALGCVAGFIPEGRGE